MSEQSRRNTSASGARSGDKVVCYVIRCEHLLVFRHRDYPQAGLQVPAGTIERGEDPEHAALREAEEETGLSGLRLIRKLREQTVSIGPDGEIHHRHFFQLDAPATAPQRWLHFAENAYWFAFEWVPLGADPGLAGLQGHLLHLVTSDTP